MTTVMIAPCCVKGSARGSLSGIATLKRAGAVEVAAGDEHDLVTSEFTVGPLQLEVSKSVSKKLTYLNTT